MAGNIGVSVARLNSTAGEVRADNKSMKTALDAIKSQISGLSKSWTGDAAKEAGRVANNMQTLFEQFSTEVEGFAKFLDQAAINWSAAETANVSNESSNASQFHA